MKKILTLRIFPVLCLTVLLAFGALAQEIITGDGELSEADVKFLQEKLYKDPQDELEDGEGARQFPPEWDISKQGGWKLKIKDQRFQTSCQSFAVAYAIDILDKTNYHSSTYIWDMLSYNFVSKTGSRHCLNTGCNTCKERFNIVAAMREAEEGIPFEENYSKNTCGAEKPNFTPDGLVRYESKHIWFNRAKYKAGTEFPVLERDQEKALNLIKEKLIVGIPVLISIDSLSFDHYDRGVFNNPDTPADYKAADWHAMTIVGYDDENRKAFKIANSWGPNKGEEGYIWISYEAFKSRVRLISFMKENTRQAKFKWEPESSKKTVFNADGSFKVRFNPYTPIGTFQIELVEQTTDKTSLCLDANMWYPDKSSSQVIMYKCQDKEKLLNLGNQQWQLILSKRINEENYYLLKSLSKQTPNKVLAFREGKLVLEDFSEEFDKNQLWLIRWSPLNNRRAIAWAGSNDEFILQVDESKLKEYSEKNAPEAVLVLEVFNNLPRQTWKFKDID